LSGDFPATFLALANLRYLESSPFDASFASLEQLAGSPSRNVPRLLIRNIVLGRPASQNQEHLVAKKAKKRTVRPYTKTEEKELRAHSKAKTPVAKISKLTKRSVAALRKKAGKMGLPLGHRR
jgi:hypothetical protein